MVRVGLIGKVAFEQRCERVKRDNPTHIWGKRTANRGAMASAEALRWECAGCSDLLQEPGTSEVGVEGKW